MVAAGAHDILLDPLQRRDLIERPDVDRTHLRVRKMAEDAHAVLDRHLDHALVRQRVGVGGLVLASAVLARAAQPAQMMTEVRGAAAAMHAPGDRRRGSTLRRRSDRRGLAVWTRSV